MKKIWEKLQDCFFIISEIFGMLFFLSPVWLIAGVILLTFFEMKKTAGILLIIGIIGAYIF